MGQLPATFECEDRDVLQEIFSRTRNSKVSGLDCLANKALKLTVKFKPFIFAELIETCISKDIIPAVWKPQEFLLLYKAGKFPGETSLTY